MTREEVVAAANAAYDAAAYYAGRRKIEKQIRTIALKYLNNGKKK